MTKTISLLILILFSVQSSFAQSGNLDFSIGISPTLGCKADYRYESSSGGSFNFTRNNYSECLSSATSSSSTSLNLGEAIAYQFFSDQKIQNAVISITNTTQDIILKNIGAVKSRDDQISQTNQNMDSILNKLRTSFDREIRHAQEHSRKWEQVNQQFDRDVIQHLENYGKNITHQIKEVEAKRSRLHDLADNNFPNSNSYSNNFSQYLSSSELQAKLKKELGDRNSHSGISLARSIYHEDSDFQQPRFVKLEQELEKTKQAGLIDQESKILFDAARKFYDSETQRQYADEIVDHLSARRIQKTTDGIQDLDQYFSHDLAGKVIDFEQKMTKARAQIKFTRQLIKNGHDFGHQLDVIKRLVNHSEMATSAASEIFYDKFMEQGELLVEMAVGTLDIATNFIPVVSFARDFYELTTGRNLFTNDQLSENERIIVGASFLTLGLGSSVKGLAKVAYEVSQSLGGISHRVIKTSERIVLFARELGLKAKDQVAGFAQFTKRVLGNEIGSIGKIDGIIDSAKTGAIKIDDAIVSTPNKLDDLKKVIKNPLSGTQYTSKVREQAASETDWHHAFPESVDGFAGLGKKTRITGGDGVVRTKIELHGNYRGKDGHFEWIVEPNKQVNHRKFTPKD